MKKDAEAIYKAAINEAMPQTAVKEALRAFAPSGKTVIISIGKAAWSMADAAYSEIHGVSGGIVITKYGHSKGKIGNLDIYEAGHPVSDENSFAATKKAIEAVSGLTENDTVVFLISGGGSALFELPAISADEYRRINSALLACGAGIVEINTVRKRLSEVKGGRFAEKCNGAKIFEIVLSDIIGNPLDMIASGPAYPDSSTCADALAVVEKYSIELSDEARESLMNETPKILRNVETHITGSVDKLCESARQAAEKLGYEAKIVTTSLDIEAKEAGVMLAKLAKENQKNDKSLAFIFGGETVVKLHGNGLGGRNQALALSAADGISGCRDTVIFSVGSDGTDGPTDAAGGIVDGESADKARKLGLDLNAYLENDDSYHALEKIGGLIKTGPTGTNVNDISVVLIKRTCEK